MPTSAARPVPLIGRIALAMKLLSADQLAELTRSQAKDGGSANLGELMVERGWIDRAQLRRLLDAQKQVVAKHRAKAALDQVDAVPEVAAAPESPARAAPSAAAAAALGRSAAPTAPPVDQVAARTAAEPVSVSVPSGSSLLDALTEILREGVSRKASDIHIHAGLPIRFRLHGAFVARDADAIPPARAEALVRGALDPDQGAALDERGELDFALALPGVGRFRVNAFRQQRGLDARLPRHAARAADPRRPRAPEPHSRSSRTTTRVWCS